jgi:prepilin-type N-terminal cleavage/methylation domain-containing protein
MNDSAGGKTPMPNADCQMPNGNAIVSRRGAEPQSSSLRASAPLRETRLSPSRNSQRATRNGFTLIELLVVIGIILILMGLFFAGAKVITAQAKARDTKTMLETAKTMFENYKQATNLSVNVPGNLSPAQTNANGPASQIAIKGASLYLNLPSGVGTSSMSYVQAAALVWSEGQEAAFAGSLAPDSVGVTNSTHTFASLPQVVQYTEVVMQAMLTIPENQTIITNLPASKIVKDPVTGITLLLDGWGNIICFSPGGGLTGVYVDPVDANPVDSTQVITSEGVQPYGYPAGGFIAGTPVANQPFFFSAGPDGDPSNAHNSSGSYDSTLNQTDDNVYSFQQ